MRQKRKDELLWRFPEVPARFMRRMHENKGAANFAVFLTNGAELYVRCFHRYSRGKNPVAERQRYVFAKDGSVRYGADDSGRWHPMKEFREPVFSLSAYGYSDNSYVMMNAEAIKKSDMKYSCYELAPSLVFEYLHLYCSHPNVEYLLKSGYKHLIVARCTGWWGNQNRLEASTYINWKSNNLLKMLNLSRTEFKLLAGEEEYYEPYIIWRKTFPKCKPEELIDIAHKFRCEVGTLTRMCSATGLKPHRITMYLTENKIISFEYLDYLDQCAKMKYNLSDTSIAMPRNFKEAHQRLTDIVKYHATKEMQQKLAALMESRTEIEFSYRGLIIRQPESVQEIIDEGRTLHHCVGGYAERHANGKLHIMFIRKASKPDVPFYTMEVSTIGDIVQVRGLRNCRMTQAVERLIEAYKQHLAAVFGKEKARKTA